MAKRLLLALIVLCVSLSAIAEEHWVKTSQISIKWEEKEWSQWEPAIMDVYMNFEEKKFIIYSEKAQVFDYVVSNSTKYSDYTYFGASCTDSKYRVCYVELFVYNIGIMYFKVSYNDIEYKYKIIL